jgi:type IX secretion system PorP/SprF family membrane protein
MKKRLLLLTAITVCLITKNYAQQDRLISHFMYDKMSVNPGETGIEDGICATAIYRNQWDKVNGAPNSAVFNLAGNTARWAFVNLGLSFYHDAIGFNRQNSLVLNIGYPIRIGNAGVLQPGIGVGMINMSYSPSWVPPTTAFDNSLPVGFGATGFDLNFGLYWKGTQDYYVGISSTHLPATSLSKKIGTNTYDYRSARHYYLMGGKKFVGLIGQNGDLDAQLIVQTDFIKTSATINARYIYRNMLYGGLAYRLSDAVGIMVGWVPFRNFTVGYNYDITINRFASISRGSHEILLKYCYMIPPPKTSKSSHPRWL